MITVLGVLILVCALFLIISVLLQSSKNHRMSGVVSGGAETFFGKQKGKTIDAKLSKITAVISVIFCILILVLYYTTAKANKADETVVNADNDIVMNDNTTSEDDAEVTPAAPADEVTEDDAAAPADEATEDDAAAPADETAEDDAAAPAEGDAE